MSERERPEERAWDGRRLGREGEGQVPVVTVFYFLLCVDGLLNGRLFRSVQNCILPNFLHFSGNIKDIFVFKILTSIFRSCEKYDSIVMISRYKRLVPVA